MWRRPSRATKETHKPGAKSQLAIDVTPLGDAALCVHLEVDFEADPVAALESVLAARERLRAANIPGIADITTAYETLGVFYDPSCAGPPELLIETIRHAIATRAAATKIGARTIEIPVCYDREFASDIADVATRAKLSVANVVELHASAEYRVVCVGFTPGFAYLSGLPRELATPRRATPRTQVPAGSVAIGGSQTGIYPQASPGGWHIIGRTPLRLFDATNDPPALLQAGDVVRFRRVARDEFSRLAK